LQHWTKKARQNQHSETKATIDGKIITHYQNHFGQWIVVYIAPGAKTHTSVVLGKGGGVNWFHMYEPELFKMLKSYIPGSNGTKPIAHCNFLTMWSVDPNAGRHPLDGLPLTSARSKTASLMKTAAKLGVVCLRIYAYRVYRAVL
jgi:hypothetical protein